VVGLHGSVMAVDACVDRTMLGVMMLKFQADILAFLTRARRATLGTADLGLPATAAGIAGEMLPFLQTAAALTADARRDLDELVLVVRTLDRHAAEVREAVNALTVIRQTSRMEAARSAGTAYDVHIEGLSAFIGRVEKTLTRLREEGRRLTTGIADVNEGVGSVHATVAQTLMAAKERAA
jgi:hypothetical protein